MATQEVFKLQRSLNRAQPIMLVYNKDRSVMQELPLTKAVEHVFAGRNKAYCWGYLEEDGDGYVLNFTEPADNQNW